MRQKKNIGGFRQICTLSTVTLQFKSFPSDLLSVQECNVFWGLRKIHPVLSDSPGKELSTITSETPCFFLPFHCPLSFGFMENVMSPTRDSNALAPITSGGSH